MQFDEKQVVQVDSIQPYILLFLFQNRSYCKHYPCQNYFRSCELLHQGHIHLTYSTYLCIKWKSSQVQLAVRLNHIRLTKPDISIMPYNG